MKYIVHNKSVGALLVILAFACWLGASALFPLSADWYFVATYSIAGSAFFIVGCLLPEYRDKRYILGRRSVLQLMASFFGLAGMSALRMDRVQVMQDSNTWVTSFLSFASIVIAFGSYYIATYLIRGFHAPVQYVIENQKTAPEDSTTISPIQP